MAAPTALAILILSTLPPDLRGAVTESMQRDALEHVVVDPRRISMTAHLRAVLEERGLMGAWRRHLYECAYGSRRSSPVFEVPQQHEAIA